MDKTIFYTTLDIDDASEFEYYENMAALLECDDYIEDNLIKDLVREVDKETFKSLIDSYFEELLKMLPDDETDLYITVESIRRILCGMVLPEMTADDVDVLALEISKVRKWFVHDLLAFDMNSGEETCVRDAVYNLAAGKLLGKKNKYDFRLACDYDTDGYDVSVYDMIAEDADDSDEDYIAGDGYIS